MFLAGLSFGISCFLTGYFDISVWGSLALVWLVVLLALALGRPALLLGPALLAVGGLLALSVWALVSTGWAESGRISKLMRQRPSASLSLRTSCTSPRTARTSQRSDVACFIRSPAKSISTRVGRPSRRITRVATARAMS